MGIADRFRRLFSILGRDDEAAEREEYGRADRGEAELERDRYSSPFASSEAAQAAEDELDELRAPREPGT